MKAAEVRFYFDEDILGLAHTVARLRPAVTYPGDPGAVLHKRERPRCPVLRGTKHRLGSVRRLTRPAIVTRDYKIRENPAERRAVRANDTKMVALFGRDAGGPWAQLELFMRHWRRIETSTAEPRPFTYLAQSSGFRAVPLD